MRNYSVTRNFGLKPVRDPEQYKFVNHKASELATDILRVCPDNREARRALHCLEEALLWVQASMSRGKSE